MSDLVFAPLLAAAFFMLGLVSFSLTQAAFRRRHAFGFVVALILTFIAFAMAGDILMIEFRP